MRTHDDGGSVSALKPCRFRVEIGQVDQFGCESTRIAHRTPGLAVLQTCLECPYAEPPGPLDFFAATEKVLLRKQRTGDYKPNPKPCGGCGTVKRRTGSAAVQFVWPYWHGGACGDEIRFSVRSVETFFQGDVRCTVIGDRPPWFNGHYISQKRVPKDTPNRRYRDMISKMWTIATHHEIDAQCVWMMDDIYFLKPVTLEYLATPRAVRWKNSQRNSWQRRKANTMKALQALGRTTYDYATHLPHVLEKAKLRALFDEFNLYQNTLLWEVLYGNTYRGKPQGIVRFFRRMTRSFSPESLGDPTVLNHTSGVWGPGLRNYLAELLPNPASCEVAGPSYKPTYRVARKKSRKVKRRPLHTHRAYIEKQQRLEKVK